MVNQINDIKSILFELSMKQVLNPTVLIYVNSMICMNNYSTQHTLKRIIVIILLTFGASVVQNGRMNKPKQDCICLIIYGLVNSKKLLLMIASQFGCSSILLSVCSIDLLMNFSTSSLLINDLFFEFGLFMLSTFSFKLTRLKSIEPYFRRYLIFPSFYASFDSSFLSLASSFFLSFLVFEIKSLK